MKLLIILFALAALIAEIAEGCNPATWTPREKEIYRCMRSKGWSNGSLRAFYDSILKPGAGGRATCSVQAQVRGCITIEDFRYYGVPDDCTPPPPPPPQPERVVYVYITPPPSPVTSAPVTSAPVPVTSAPVYTPPPPGPAGAVGGTPPAGAVGGTPPAGAVGGTPPAGAVGGIPPAGAVGGTPPASSPSYGVKPVSG